MKNKNQRSKIKKLRLSSKTNKKNLIIGFLRFSKGGMRSQRLLKSMFLQYKHKTETRLNKKIKLQ